MTGSPFRIARILTANAERQARISKRMTDGTLGGRSLVAAPPSQRPATIRLPDRPAAGGASGRAATLVVAAANSSAAGRAAADYVCDGVADEAEFNAAAAALYDATEGFNRGRIVALEGDFQIAGRIEFTGGIDLEGMGKYASRIHAAAGFSDFTMFYGSGLLGGGVRGIGFDLNFETLTGTASLRAAVRWDTPYDSTVEDVEIYNLGAEESLHLYNAALTLIQHNLFTGPVRTRGVCSLITLRSCELGAGNTGPYALHGAGLANSWIQANDIVANGTGDAALLDSCTDTIYADNVHRRSSGADNTTRGLTLTNSARCDVHGNQFRKRNNLNRYLYGIDVQGAGNVDNWVHDNDLFDSWVTAAIQDTGTATDTAAGNRT